MTAAQSVIEEFAPAKVNLALHVTARRADGYHELDSIVAFAGAGDRITVRPARTDTFEVTGPFANALAGQGDNIIARALDMVRASASQPLPSLQVTLEKNLPVASGIGGGSADAAALLRALLRFAGRIVEPAALLRIALALGADVPVCLTGKACRMQGIGETILPLQAMPSFPAVLVNPLQSVSTPEVFVALGLSSGNPAFSRLEDPPELSSVDVWLDWLSRCRNDLAEPAIAVCPGISEVLDILHKLPGCRLARMSGSGATCFALFDDGEAAKAAAAKISAQRPDWWVQPTMLG